MVHEDDAFEYRDENRIYLRDPQGHLREVTDYQRELNLERMRSESLLACLHVICDFGSISAVDLAKQAIAEYEASK